MKHLCPTCGRFIKWALLLCWECNVKLKQTDGATVGPDGNTEYPVYQPN